MISAHFYNMNLRTFPTRLSKKTHGNHQNISGKLYEQNNYELKCRSTRRLAVVVNLREAREIVISKHHICFLLPLPLLLFVSLKTQTRENIYQSSGFVYQVIVTANQTVMYLIMK